MLANLVVGILEMKFGVASIRTQIRFLCVKFFVKTFTCHPVVRLQRRLIFWTMCQMWNSGSLLTIPFLKKIWKRVERWVARFSLAKHTKMGKKYQMATNCAKRP
jgi:hypothetical protein